MKTKYILQAKKISLKRIGLTIIVLAIVGVGSYYGMQWWEARAEAIAQKPWFAAYVDVTATPTYDFEQMGSSTTKDAILSFMVSSPTNACTPSWGGAYSLNTAGSVLDLDTRIARLQQQGGSIAISFGGQRNSELAINCTNQTELLDAYQSVITRYHINTIDLDVEGTALTNTASQIRRAEVLATLQREERAKGNNLAIWLTIPVSPQGLTQDGTNAVSIMLKHGVDLAGVNIMTMDYGSSLLGGETMLSAAQDALTQTQRQLGVIYEQNHIYLTPQSIWAKLGVTLMIGQNDDANEIFTLFDAQGLNTYAHQEGVGRVSMWSKNRDITCGSNYVNTSVVSDSCSGVEENNTTFTKVLGRGFDGNISLSASLVTQGQLNKQAQTPDNPATSPYQIWSAAGVYLEGTKIVWHHNIYQAKWWTQGDVPDNPVLQSWQTPWQLLGPVLPGQTPIPQPTLPVGTYPNWSGSAIYTEGQRVLFNGVPYAAKWWDQGNSPEDALTNPNASPWQQLNQQQLSTIVTPSN